MSDVIEAPNQIKGISTQLKNGSTVFVGNDETDVWLKFTNADGVVTPLRLSEEAAFATAKMILMQYQETDISDAVESGVCT